MSGKKARVNGYQITRSRTCDTAAFARQLARSINTTVPRIVSRVRRPRMQRGSICCKHARARSWADGELKAFGRFSNRFEVTNV
jgi:hypothetical protein